MEMASGSDWPSTRQLEEWLMETSAENDPGAAFLRRVLRIHAGYGSYMSSSDDLAEMVRKSAKLLRNIVLQADGIVKPVLFYQSLYSLVWRVIGHMFHCMLELQNHQELPVPTKALGQLKMLIKTNEELSQQLKESRRTYLKEVSMLRDRSRNWSPKVQRALDSLQDNPVIFHEPLCHVLDQTTKDFVNEVVEERLKLELGRVLDPDEDKQREMDSMDDKMKVLEAENRRLRAEAARATEKARRLEELEKVARDDANQQAQASGLLQEQLRAALEALEENQLALRRLQDKLDNTPVEQEKAIADKEVSATLPDATPDLQKHVDDQNSELVALRERLVQLEAERQEQADRIAVLSGEIDTLQATGEKCQEAAKGGEEVALAHNVELMQQIDNHLQIEKELRESINQLQRALDAEKAALTAMQSQLDASLKREKENKAPKEAPPSPSQKIQYVVKVAEESNEAAPPPKTKPTKAPRKEHDEQDEKGKKALAKLEKQCAQLQAELEKMRIERDEALSKFEQAERSVAEEAVLAGSLTLGDEEKIPNEKWKSRYVDLRHHYDELENEKEALEHKVKVLLDKLQQCGGEQAVGEVLAEIKRSAPLAKKKRRQVVWRRLYEDAQRRTRDMEERREALLKQEEEHLQELATLSMKRRSLSVSRQVAALAHLHNAHTETAETFDKALSHFQKRNADILWSNADQGFCANGDASDVRRESCHQIRSSSPLSHVSSTFETTCDETDDVARLDSWGSIVSQAEPRRKPMSPQANSTKGNADMIVQGTAVIRETRPSSRDGLRSPQMQGRKPLPNIASEDHDLAAGLTRNANLFGTCASVDETAGAFGSLPEEVEDGNSLSGTQRYIDFTQATGNRVSTSPTAMSGGIDTANWKQQQEECLASALSLGTHSIHSNSTHISNVDWTPKAVLMHSNVDMSVLGVSLSREKTVSSCNASTLTQIQQQHSPSDNVENHERDSISKSTEKNEVVQKAGKLTEGVGSSLGGPQRSAACAQTLRGNVAGSTNAIPIGIDASTRKRFHRQSTTSSPTFSMQSPHSHSAQGSNSDWAPKLTKVLPRTCSTGILEPISSPRQTKQRAASQSPVHSPRLTRPSFELAAKIDTKSIATGVGFDKSSPSFVMHAAAISTLSCSTDWAPRMTKVLSRTCSTGGLEPLLTPRQRKQHDSTQSPATSPRSTKQLVERGVKGSIKGTAMCGGAGKPPPGLSMRTVVPLTVSAKNDASAACLGHWFHGPAHLSASSLAPDRPIDKTQTQGSLTSQVSPGAEQAQSQQFCVVPLVSQQSLASGSPVPVIIRQ